jgi:hypothetical protein
LGIAVVGSMNPLDSDMSQTPFRLFCDNVTWRISGPRAVSSSRNESMSAPIAASVPPLPPVSEIFMLVIVGRASNSVMALKKLLVAWGTAPPA